MTSEHANERLTPPLAATPIAALVLMLAGAVYLFGADASYGANQIALVLATFLAALVGWRTGIDWHTAQAGIVDGIGVGLTPTLILLAVGMLIGSWILAGTVPTMIFYGVGLLDPRFFYAAAAVICAVVALSIGSSWTVAGTLGIGLMGIAGSFGLSPAITAGAIVSGAYFGDKMSPMSDTTNLAAASAGVDLFDHIRHMLWTTVPAFLFAVLVLALTGSGADGEPVQIARLRDSLAREFDPGPHLLLPLALMLFLVYRRFPAYPAIVLSAAAGGVMALLFQPEQVARLGGDAPGGAAGAQARGLWAALADGYRSDSGSDDLDRLLSKGGMSSMLNTVWLILCALGFGGILERTGILTFWLEFALRGVRSTGSLVATTVVTCVGTNSMAADQFLSLALSGRMFRRAYLERGLSPLNLSRSLEDSATLTSALIPWNTCGAYMSATLGVATLSYAPYAFFNLACPLLAVLYGFAGFAQKPLEGKTAGRASSRSEPP